MNYEFANIFDASELHRIEECIPEAVVQEKINKREIVVCRNEGRIVALLRFSMFWDQYPFINLLKVEKAYQRNRIGSELLRFWEEEMCKLSHSVVMASAQSDETAQEFFRKKGYKVTGSFSFPNQADELVLLKHLKSSAQPVAGGDATR